jgi:hypothetical protein
MGRIRRVAIALWIGLVTPLELQSQGIRGRLVDDVADQAIEAAAVRLLDVEGEVVASGVTDASGSFELRVPSGGDYALDLHAFGYRDLALSPVRVPSTGFRVLEIAMMPAPIPVDSLEARAERRVPRLDRAGFYERRGTFNGRFIERQEIEALDPRHLGQVLERVQGFRVQRHLGTQDLAGRTPTSQSLISSGSRCRPAIYLNGVLVARPDRDAGTFDLMSIQGDHIEAIEAYSGLAKVPSQFSMPNTVCGVVIVWTR